MRYCIQCVEISLLRHQIVKGAGLGDAAVLQNENAVIAAQRRLFQRVRDDDARNAGQGQDTVSYRDSGETVRSSVPSRRIFPAYAMPGVVRRFRSVDFPLPLAPTIA